VPQLVETDPWVILSTLKSTRVKDAMVKALHVGNAEAMKCTTCAWRIPRIGKRTQEHMDEHFRENTEKDTQIQSGFLYSQTWFKSELEWIGQKTRSPPTPDAPEPVESTSVQTDKSETGNPLSMVNTVVEGDLQAVCPGCGEAVVFKFDVFVPNEWAYDECFYTREDVSAASPIYHRTCFNDK
jgi:hypothetical protein